MKRQIGHRISATLMGLAVWAITMLDPSSLQARLVAESGGTAWVVANVLGLLSLGGLLDVLINDVASDRWQLQLTLHMRHVGYCLFAICNLAFVHEMASHHTVTWIAAIYGVQAFSGAYIATVDTVLRFVMPRIHPRQPDRRSGIDRRGTYVA